MEFGGEGEEGKGIDKATGKVLVEVSPDFYRPTDVINLWGDSRKQRNDWDGTQSKHALKNWLP